MSTENEKSNTEPVTTEPVTSKAVNSPEPEPEPENDTKNENTNSASSLAGPTLAEAAAKAKRSQDSKNSNKSSRPKFRKNKFTLTGGNLAEQQKASNCPVRLSIETEQDKNEKRRFNREKYDKRNNYAGGDNDKSEKHDDSGKTDGEGKNNGFHKNSQEYAGGDRVHRPYKPRNPLTRKLFVGSLPLEVEENEIAEYFNKYGTVEHVMIKVNRGFAFVTFETIEDATKVLSFKGHKWGDNDMVVKPAINNENRRQFNEYKNNEYKKNPVRNVNSLINPYRKFEEILCGFWKLKKYERKVYFKCDFS